MKTKHGDFHVYMNYVHMNITKKKKQITTEVSISVLSYQQLNEFKQDDPSYIFTNGGGWCKVTVTVMPTECASLTYWFHATTELMCE